MSDDLKCVQRTAILYKDNIIGCFFLYCSPDTNVVWTFDPRLSPNLYWFKHQTADLAHKRYNELINISQQNGWKLHFNNHPNDARLS